MPKEQAFYPRGQRPYEVLGLTAQEQRAGLLKNEKLKEILAAPDTRLHAVKQSFNHYGEFLFITLSRQGGQGRVFATFYGLGYHKYRERWITNEWFWYQSIGNTEIHNQTITPETLNEAVATAQESIRPKIKTHTQTPRGKLFELLASISDDDAALAEIEQIDLFILAHHLQNEPHPNDED